MAKLEMNRDFFIYTRDVDSNDIIKPHAISEIFQDVAAIHADELGVGYNECKKDGIAWIILYNKIEIVKPPKYFSDVIVKTWPKPHRRIEYNREYLMVDKNDDILIKGISNWAIIDYNNRTILRKPIVFNGEFIDYTNYEEPAKRKLDLDCLNLTDYFEYHPNADDIDHNGHVNNSRYLKILFDYLNPTESNNYINYIEIAYIKEAKIDSNIKIGYNKTKENKYEFIGFINDEKCFEAIIGVKEYE